MVFKKSLISLLVGSFFIGLILIINGCEKTEQIKPNIVLIIGDDHGYPYFGFMGSDYVQTPNMDSLANQGTLFTNGYVPENHCRPALQSLITGLLPIDYKQKSDSIKQALKKTDLYLSLSAKDKQDWENNFYYHSMQYFQTLPGYLSELGYKSFQTGKWWEYHYKYGGFTNGMTKGWIREKRNGLNWFEQFMGGEGTQIGRITNQPVFDFIMENNDYPFFIWYAPQLPHYPFDAPEKYLKIYSDKGFSKSAVEYYANCTWFDDSVGELISFLKKKDLFKNTLFIYVNDNGWEQGPNQEYADDPMRSHNGGDKGKLSVFDLSYRTPIIFTWEGYIQRGVRRSDLIHSTDIPATILDYAGLQKTKMHYGISYKDVIEGEKKNHRNFIVGKSKKIRDDIDPMGRDVEAYWIRDIDWFYKSNKTDNDNALYNINDDPFCDEDLSKKYPKIVNNLSKIINREYPTAPQ